MPWETCMFLVPRRLCLTEVRQLSDPFGYRLSVRPCGREGNPRHRRRNATLPNGTGQDRAPPRQRRSKTANLQDRRGASQRPSTPQDVADRAPPTPPGHAGPTNALASWPLGASAGGKAGQGWALYPRRALTLMRPPVVKRQKYPMNGFLLFFRLGDSGSVGSRERVLT